MRWPRESVVCLRGSVGLAFLLGGLEGGNVDLGWDCRGEAVLWCWVVESGLVLEGSFSLSELDEGWNVGRLRLREYVANFCIVEEVLVGIDMLW